MRDRYITTIFVSTLLCFQYGCQLDPPAAAGAPPALQPIRNAREMLDAKTSTFISRPAPEKFSICYGNTCRYIVELGLTQEEWGRISGLFTTAALAADAERAQIRSAVALLEEMVGVKAGTSADRGENLNGLGLAGQMDCVDEATNTSVYLTLLQDAGLLRWHTVQHRISRGVASLQVPHFTAVIRDEKERLSYAVDSWFLDNGEPPFIVPLPIWEKGWRPSRDQHNAGR